MKRKKQAASRTKFDVAVVSGAGIDTNVYLQGDDVDFSVEANFTENIDYLGQAGGYSSRGFASLGKNVALIDYLGDDYHGHFIRKELKNSGVNIDGVFTDSKGTRRSVNFMYKDGRRKNFYDGKGSMEIRPNITACRRVLSKTKLAHFNIVNFSRYLLPVAKELGVTISCDIQDIVSSDDEYRRDYVDHADVLFFSSVNHPDPTSLMLKFLESNPNRIVIAGMGARGCGVAVANGIRFFPAVDLFGPVIDTNGAGDALAVGFLSSYFIDGFSLEDSVLRGQIAARYTCTIKASSSALITKSKLNSGFKQLKAQMKSLTAEVAKIAKEFSFGFFTRNELIFTCRFSTLNQPPLRKSLNANKSKESLREPRNPPLV